MASVSYNYATHVYEYWSVNEEGVHMSDKCYICNCSLKVHHYEHPQGRLLCSAMCYERLEQRIVGAEDLQLDLFDSQRDYGDETDVLKPPV
jgi:hypothetical protein